MNEDFTTPENLNEDTVISEIFIVKREIILSFLHALKTLGTLERIKSLGGKSRGSEADFGMYCLNLFLKIRPFFDDNKIKGNLKKDAEKMKKEIELAVKKGNPISFEQWKMYFFLMSDILRKLKIYGIGFQKIDSKEAWMDGLT